MKPKVEAEFQVSAGNGSDVVFTVHISSLNSAESVAEENFYTFNATKVFVVAFFDAKVTAIVTALIIRVAFDVFLRHLTEVAEDVSGSCVVVLS